VRRLPVVSEHPGFMEFVGNILDHKHGPCVPTQVHPKCHNFIIFHIHGQWKQNRASPEPDQQVLHGGGRAGEKVGGPTNLSSTGPCHICWAQSVGVEGGASQTTVRACRVQLCELPVSFCLHRFMYLKHPKDVLQHRTSRMPRILCVCSRAVNR